MSHRIMKDLGLAITKVNTLVTGAVITPNGQAGMYFELPTGTYTVAAENPPMFCFVKCTGGTATITGAGVLSSGQVGMLVADSSSSWSLHVYATSGADDFAAMLVAALGADATLVPFGDSNSTFTATNVEEAINELAVLINTKYNTTAAASPVTPAAGILTGARHVYYEITTDGAFSLVTRTATQLYGDHGSPVVAGPNASFELTIVNRGNNTVTITAGSGITATGELTLATLTTRTYVCTFTSGTAMTMVSVDKGTIET